MPFKSLAQDKWGNSPAGRKALGSKLAEFNSASKGLKLPARIGPKPTGVLGTGLKPLKPLNLKQATTAIRNKRRGMA